ncbi:hypothetical protein EDD18DRAFT_1208410 [Armillaria luteobubalina]|uniref:Uncharacterized protein n=1 Tax=Armillaria luteobubalina TaxID=153913 RepID=A0AA39UH67_9AGAR|nr:hypothetical protein EDD18DRAFT_1208410 [Armillaria luteobubalina]
MILRIPPALRGTSLSLGRLMTFRRTFARIATSLRPCPDISTLNAVNLSRDDFCDFSNMVTVGAVGDPSPQRFTYQRVGNHYIPFPRSCKGFLYYWTHTDLPAIFGDLCMPNGIPWSVPLGQAVGRNGKMLQLLLKDGLVDQSFVKLRLKTGSVLLQSFEEPFVLSLPQDSVRVHLLSKGRPPEKVFLAFKPMPEIQNLVEGGQKVHAHARLEVSQPKSNSLRVRLRILRVFVQGVPLDSEFSPVECRSMTGLSAFLSWLPSTYELPQSFYGEKCNNDG